MNSSNLKFSFENLINQKWWSKYLFFLLSSLILFLPFLIKGEIITWYDSNFHLTRILEIIKQQQTGQLFPDIVQYSGLQHWGYGLNLFYPPYALMPLIFLWRLLDNPVLAFILFDIFIVYFALVINYSVFKKASNNTLFSFLSTYTYIFTASAGRMPASSADAMNIPVVGIALLNQLTSNIVFLFAPVVLISFYQIIFKNDKDFWRYAAPFSAISAMLSIPATLGLVIIILLMFILGIIQKKINTKNFSVLIKTAITTVLLSAIFIIPFLEQRLGSSWAALPNRQTLWGKSFFDVVIKNIFNFSDIHSVFLIVILFLLFIHKKMDKTYKQLALGYLTSLLFLHSSVFPWWLVQDLLAGTLQYPSRWDYIPRLLGSIFIARGMIELSQEKSKIIPIITSATLLFAILGMYGNTLSTYFPILPAGQVGPSKPVSGNRTESFEPTKDNLSMGLFFRVNPTNIDVIFNNNSISDDSLRQNNNSPIYSSLNFDDYRIEGQYRDHRQVYAKSLVKFDGASHENMTSAQGEDFFINNLPQNIETVQAPITYLKGFQAFDTKGNKLNSYKNEDGFLEIEPNGSETVKITYEKTLLHKASIVISIVSWIIFLLGILLHKLTKGGRPRAKTINSRTSLQRRRNTRAFR